MQLPLPSLAATAACRSRHGPPASCSAPMASRLRCLLTVRPGCLPGHRHYLDRHDSLGFDAGHLPCPVVPRELSERLARPPPAVSGCPFRPSKQRLAHPVDSPPPPVNRAAWRIRAHAGASPAAVPPYSRIAQLRFGTWASPSTSYGCRARAGFPPACWSPSLSGWLPTTPPKGGTNMAATIAAAPRRHQNNLLSTLAATALRADLAPRHYRIPPPGDMPRKTTSAASGRRNGSDGPCASDRLPDEHPHAADHRLLGAGQRDVGDARVRRAQDPLTSLDGHQPHQRRAAGAVRPHRHHPAVGRRLVGLAYGRAVCDILEGGERAFRERARRLRVGLPR